MHNVVHNLKAVGLMDTKSPEANPLLSPASYAWNAKRLQRGMVTVGRTCVPFDAALELAEQTHGKVPFVMIRNRDDILERRTQKDTSE